MSGPRTFLLQRLLVLPAQLAFILLILFISITVPADVATRQDPGFLGLLQDFGVTLFNLFTGNWGVADFGRFHLPWLQVYAYYLPSSLQIALFALPLAAGIAYPVSLVAGWSRRPGAEAPSQLATLIGALVPVFVVGLLAVNLLFFAYLGWLNDVPDQGILPSTSWFAGRGGYPPWILYFAVTRPTGLPLVDAVIHQDWQVAFISLTKTVLQALVVALAYLAIFYRHALTVVRSTRESPYIVGARARGVSERTLLWRHTARAVTPSFLLIFALTIPEYLGVQFAVEVAFVDQAGIGYLTFVDATSGSLGDLVPLVFVLAILVLSWTLVVDVLSIRSAPAGLAAA